MKERKPLRSEMGWSTTETITVRGYDLPSQLLGKIDLGGMAWLEITGRMPNPKEAEVFNALLVTLVEHGMTPQAIASRLVTRSSTVRGTLKKRWVRPPEPVSVSVVRMSRVAGSCSASYIVAMERTLLRKAGCAVTSFTFSPWK